MKQSGTGERVLKKIIAAWLFMCMLTACTGPTSGGGDITILDKQLIGSTYWIVAEKTHSKEEGPVKIKVDNENTWNLLEVGRTYLSTYSYKSLDKGAKLLSVRHINEGQSATK
ncbi:hypothetical protein CPT76_32120 [Paenibacillus sp. AR247]|nr:hypothetical protein CPT76_32120 [Paenibacillus sp. AR247]